METPESGEHDLLLGIPVTTYRSRWVRTYQRLRNSKKPALAVMFIALLIDFMLLTTAGKVQVCIHLDWSTCSETNSYNSIA